MAEIIEIEGRKIGPGHPCYIIAELSCNHEGSLDNALRIIEVAALKGADAIKVQTYTAETMTRGFRHRPSGTMWEGIDLYSLYQKAYTPWEWHQILQRRTQELGMHFFSSPFDESAVDFLVSLGVPALKVASFEVVDAKLLEKIATTGLPVLMSTGMTDFLELSEAVETLSKGGCSQIALFQCNSGYPASFDDANLNTIPLLRRLFRMPIGLSDHILFEQADSLLTPVPHVSPLEAVRKGANMIEVHLTLDRAKARKLNESGDGGFDWAFSREPEEFEQLVKMIRHFESTGEVEYGSDVERSCAARSHGVASLVPTEREAASRRCRPSLWVIAPVSKGEKLVFAAGATGNFDSLRPGGGLEVRFADLVSTLTACRDLAPGVPLTWDDVELD